MPQLAGFTLPLVLGNLFQLTYNAADSVIVGRFLGSDALAAVGTAGPIMNMVILFISGLCMGAGILMSMQFGAGDTALLRRQMSTTLIAGLCFSFMTTILMLCFAPLVLRLIQVPESVRAAAASYLRIVFIGLACTFLYNFFSNTLRALGDGTTPLYFLMFGSLLNIASGIFFVVSLGWGVNGSAIATVLSQGASCAGCAVYIKKRVPLLCLGRDWRIFDRGLLLRTVSYAITSALQMMCVQLGKICVQVLVNTQGIAFMAAFTIINRIDDFVLTPQQNIAHAATTFIAQNRGAGLSDRVRRGFVCSIILEAVYTATVSLFLFIAAAPVTHFFADDPQVRALSISYLLLISLMYLMPAATNIMQGFFRSMGNLTITLVSTLANMSARVLAAWILISLLHQGFEALAWANFWGWVAMLLIETPLLFKYLRCI